MAQGERSSSFELTSGVPHACLISTLLFSFVTDEVMGNSFGVQQNIGVARRNSENLCGPYYAGGFACLFECTELAQRS